MLYGGRINDEAVDRLLCGVYASFHGADKSRGGGGGRERDERNSYHGSGGLR